jgi:hypothetical protein
MQRRIFLKLSVGGSVIGWLGCTNELMQSELVGENQEPGTRNQEPGMEPGSGIDEEIPIEPMYVVMYDTYAQALYYDGTEGPKTGIITVDMILANQAVKLDFWHGHGGQKHRYEIRPEHYAELKAGKRVYLETTEVQSHSHTLFIDPVLPKYRVPGATPVEVPLP